MSKIFWAVAAVLAVSACNPETPKVAFKHAEQRGRLESNGLRFVLMPDPTTQLVEVDVRYEVGSKEDPPGKAGLAHLAEHLMFQLKPGGPTDVPVMQTIGDISTFFNAYTDWDTTHYMTTARAEQLELLLSIEATRLHLGCQSISEEEFLREREVVRNEIRQRTGTAEGQIWQLVLSAVYPKGHAYERMIGGDDHQLTNITLADACKFIRDYYTPDRATLIIAGGFEIDHAVDRIQHWFGGLEKRSGAPRAKVAPVVLQRGRVQHDLDVERPSVHVAWAIPPLYSREGEAVQFGLNQAFFRAASKAQEYEFAYSVFPQLLGGKDAPVFVISMELKGMSKLGEALEFVDKAAKRAYRGLDEGTALQIEEWQNLQKADFIESLEPLQARTRTLGDLVQFSEFDFDSSGLYIFNELDKLSRFDGERAASAVKKWIDPAKARVVVIKPNEEGIKGDKRNTAVKFQTKSHDEKVLPHVDPAEAKRPLKVTAELKALAGAQRFQLGNGMNVVMLPIHSMPLATAHLIFNNVGEAIAPDNPYLASAAANFLRLPLDAEAFARTGVGVRCFAGADATTCVSSGLNIYLDVMLKGLERLIKAGTYSQEQVERWQKSERESMQTRTSQQETEFRRQMLTSLYGPDHPYTKTGVTTPDAVGKISRDGLDDFRRNHYTAGNATLIVVGSFDPKQAESMVRSVFGDWSKGTVDKPVSAAALERTGPAFIGVVAKEEPQLTVAIAYPAPAGVDGQQGARQVLAEMLNTRMGDVRFKLGSTYGVYAGRQPRKGPTAYQMGGTVDAPRAGESIRAMRDGVQMLRDGGEQFDIDFVRARRKILSNLLGESTVTSELASRLGFISRFDLPAGYYNTLLQQVAAVSTAQVRALIAKELDPAHEVIVVQGSREQLEAAFRDAGITDVKIIEPDYK